MNAYKGKTQAWQKVMTSDLPTARGMTACTLGSALGPTLGNEYGRTLSFFTFNKSIVP